MTEPLDPNAAKCRLCLAEAPLCQSHIIPELCFQPLYDPQSRNFIEFDVDTARVRKHQKGFREPLLCRGCESKINNYEKHARRLYIDPLPTPRSGTKTIFDYPQLEYRLLKLYAMSLVWRASVSSLDTFKHVDLGLYSEEFRTCLLNGVAPAPTRFGCTIFRVTLEGAHFTDFMPNPTFAKMDGHRYYRFLVRGFLFLVFGSPRLPKVQEPLIISDQVPIFVVNSDFFSHKFLAKLWDTANARNLPEF